MNISEQKFLDLQYTNALAFQDPINNHTIVQTPEANFIGQYARGEGKVS